MSQTSDRIEHLPECLANDYGETYDCICDELRACEQRVNGHRLSYENGVEVGYNKGYVAGLDAAREAVLAYANDTDKHIGMVKCWPENGDRCDITAALRVAARQIDALREEPR